MAKISVVINTLNEEKFLKSCLESVKWADEVIVADMHSDDGSAKVARNFGAKVVLHKRVNFVEPARNFAISKVTNDWVLVLDPDEEVPEKLAKRLQQIAEKMNQINFVRISRKNLIFGKWMKAAMWWPDYNIRFFKKGSVNWTDEIHRPPKTEGIGIDLEPEEDLSIFHHHYDSISQFLNRLNRYTEVQAKELIKTGYRFTWSDLIIKPTGEFLGRFFANRGFEDGLHGLALSLLQGFSFLIMYLKVWEIDSFSDQEITIKELKETKNKMGSEITYWFKYGTLSKNPFKRFIQKAKNKITP